MFTLEFLEEQLRARPFVPFTVVTNSGDRFRIKTSDRCWWASNSLGLIPGGAPDARFRLNEEARLVPPL